MGNMKRLCLVFLGVFGQDYSGDYGDYQIWEPTCAKIYGEQIEMLAKLESFGVEEFLSSMPKFSIVDIYTMLSQFGKQAIRDFEAIRSNQLVQFSKNCKQNLKGFSLRKVVTAKTNREALEITVIKAVQLLQRMGVKRGVCKKLKEFLDHKVDSAFGKIEKARKEFGDEVVDEIMDDITEFRKEELNDHLVTIKSKEVFALQLLHLVVLGICIRRRIFKALKVFWFNWAMNSKELLFITKEESTNSRVIIQKAKMTSKTKRTVF